MTWIRTRLAAIRRHPALIAVAVAIIVLAAAFGWLIGFLPGMGALTIFALLVWWGVLELGARRARKSGRERTPRDEARFAVLAAVAVVVIGFGLMQAVPYGRDHTNPPATGEPTWASQETRTLMVRACFQCHSSEVKYPWYANIAPTSWAVQRHLDEGRGKVNYSTFATDPGKADETVEVIRNGEMPPAYFTRFGLNGQAKLSDAEIATLVAGLEKTPGLSGGAEGGESGDRD